jgi:hypothetical protein
LKKKKKRTCSKVEEEIDKDEFRRENESFHQKKKKGIITDQKLPQMSPFIPFCNCLKCPKTRNIFLDPGDNLEIAYKCIYIFSLNTLFCRFLFKFMMH